MRRLGLSTRRRRLVAVVIGVVVVCGTAVGVALGRGGGPSQASATPTPVPGATSSPSRAATPSPTGASPAGPHVLVIMEENSSYEEIIGSPSAPYINSLARRYASATQWYSLKHGSIQNYLAATSGQIPPTAVINNECTPGQGLCTTSAPNLADQLEARGLTWKSYQEDMPVPCFRAYSAAHYVARHNPFIYYSQIRDNPVRCNRIVPFTQFAADLAANAVPNFAWVTPNLCNDMHNACPGGRVENGDTWLAQQLGPILASAWFQQGGEVVITWDESEDIDASGCCAGARGGHIATLVLSGRSTGVTWSHPGDHFGLLRGLEGVFGVPFIGAAAARIHGDLGALL
ncbi:MAG TPA: alkaline phosphatase family protein [Candidatus Dormibacteraeota bacterium]